MNETITLQAPKLPDPKVFFIASLSNGEIIVENRGDWCWVDGLKSPWNRLIRYVAEKDLVINSLSLSTPEGKTYTMPPAGGKPRFKGYTNRTPDEVPMYYEVKRYLARDMDVGIKNGKGRIEGVAVAEFYTYAEAIYRDFSIQLWVDELDQRHSWVVFNKIKP